MYKRLLDSLPVNKLKEWSNQTGTKNEVIEHIYDHETIQSINNYISMNFGHLHQSGFLFTTQTAVNIGNTVFPTFSNIYNGNSGNFQERIYLKTIQLPYYDSESDSRETLNFFVPIRILNNGRVVRIFIHTIGRNVKSYFDHEVFPTGRVSIEDDILEEVRIAIGQELIPKDINSGVKHLWRNDYIDGYLVKNKRALSLKTEVMDENNTFKDSYPDEFEDLMLTPLRRTKFRYNGPDEIVAKFDINASVGHIVINRHSEGDNDMDTLINLILANNA